jgi:hypothetical protein
VSIVEARLREAFNHLFGISWESKPSSEIISDVVLSRSANFQVEIRSAAVKVLISNENIINVGCFFFEFLY